MEEPQQDINYDKILETLVNTFGNVLSEDVYLTIIESCEGDLQESANAVVSIIMDGNSASKNEETEGNNSSLANNVDVIPTQSNVQAVPDLSRAAQVPVPNKTKNISSYAKVSQTSRPQQQLKPKATTSTTNMTSNFWTNQIRQIMSQNESGARILIIMRGVPGSGKSFIAKQIMNAMYGAQLQQHYYAHVLSTDDFFINRGVYCYNKYRLQEAHAWNQSRAQQAMREGVSPVIIDNTNIEIWEMEPYVKEGVRNGYIVEVVEPNTPWAKKSNELVKRNSHNVPAQTIKRMLDNYENGITGAVLMRKLNCYYDHRMQPPVLRLVPRVSRISQSMSNMVKKIKVSEDRNEKAQQETQKVNPSQVMLQALTLKADVNGEVPSDDSKSESSNSIKHKEDKISTHQDEDELKNDNVEENDKFIEIKKTLEEIEKVEVEWETGESWDESSKKTNTKNDEQIQEVQGSKPQRKNRGPRTNSEQSEQESDQNNQESEHNEQESEQMDQESQQNEQVSGQNEQNAEQNMADNDQQTPSTSESIASDNSKPSTSKEDEAESSDDEYVAFEDQENTVNVNLGKEFVRHLDVLFGRDIDYPANVKPMIRIPVSLLNEINALWIESIMHQLAENAKQTELMIRQDEEFARELANKERELHKAGKEPAVPDFREIMDMEFALSLYRKDVAELCNNSKPQDLAAMLSRQKLKNLFPEIPADTLSEMLQAHDENFKATIEVLLISTNQEEILDEKDGINRFIAKRELERQRERLAREQKRILSEVEWPLLPKTDNVDMSVVQHYREQADQHLQYRNEYYKKAQEYVRRGMTDVATYCSGVAAFHKHNYEYSNSLAAAALIQFHGQNNPDTATIDLHFLRVSEAKESMDLFLDLHIKKLREIQEKGPVKPYTVYFITGRGLHSNGKPKIKPAVKKRLRERGLIYGERNPGLIQAKVSANDKLSHQVA